MAPPASRVADARSFLFVPGSRPDRFDKARTSGADVVILDLEDAVAPEDKPAALRHVLGWLARGNRALVRVNGARTPWHAAEVSELADLGCDLMVPKSEDPDDLARVADRVGGGLVALVETARGVREVDAIASVAGVYRLALGTIDLAADLGVDPDSASAMSYSRGRLVVASAAAALPPPVDGVTTTLGDRDGLLAQSRAARGLGFGGKLCIHPRQVATVNESFQPTADEVRWAEEVAKAAAPGGVTVVEGAMVDPPVLLRALSILRLARTEPDERTPTSGS